jgi:hypothetical protein
VSLCGVSHPAVYAKANAVMPIAAPIAAKAASGKASDVLRESAMPSPLQTA